MQCLLGIQWQHNPSYSSSTYADVVSRENMRITFTYATLNGLNICTASIPTELDVSEDLETKNQHTTYLLWVCCGGWSNLGMLISVLRFHYYHLTLSLLSSVGQDHLDTTNTLAKPFTN